MTPSNHLNRKQIGPLLRSSLETPTSEFLSFTRENPDYEYLFNDKYYIVIVKHNNHTNAVVSKTQFVSENLLDLFINTEENQLGRQQMKFDSIKTVSDKTYKSKCVKDSLIKYPLSEEITLKKLDSHQVKLNSKFYLLMNNCKKAKDSCKFNSNKKYFACKQK